MQLTTLFDTLSTGGSSIDNSTTATFAIRRQTAQSLPNSVAAQTVATNDFAAESALIPCREYDSEMWFAEAKTQIEQAKSLCLACPVRMGCLAGAVDRSEPWGVWGGEVFVDGAVVAHKRGRGRPRKDERRVAPLAA